MRVLLHSILVFCLLWTPISSALALCCVNPAAQPTAATKTVSTMDTAGLPCHQYVDTAQHNLVDAEPSNMDCNQQCLHVAAILPTALLENTLALAAMHNIAMASPAAKHQLGIFRPPTL